MKIKKQNNNLAFVISLIVLLQSCTVYQSVPVSMEDAASQDIKAKVKPLQALTSNTTTLYLRTENITV
ncbi:hypothetical protein H7U19_02345 [Hyunsoonleella sp. SJ7]|uniref:Uncharacterized protein n=1 Tax=Hyunsoonleella aquatilis TaxID=2762758 RepID=A0A923H955_9FLAO|nr:hypothetical protein [Hyunsoonleella aquatilis]MBC3757227.1 hypothetical protein [Hyunsoonleella aquatilis]